MLRRALAAPLLLALACGPLGPLPGGRLEGELAPAPADWSFSDAAKTVQLETDPAEPYSVNIWGVGLGSAFYVASGEGGSSRWAQNISSDPRVRLQVDGRLYALRAARVEDPTEIERVLAALVEKYDFEPDEEQRAQAWLFRLEPR